MIDWERIDRVLAGEATPEETAAVEAWAASDPAHAALLASLREETPADTDAAWRRLRASVLEDDAPAVAGAIAPQPSRRTWLRAAAIAILAVGLAAIWQTTRTPPTIRLSTTAEGAPRTVMLPDGSTVTLAIGATLRWEEPFAPDARTVALDGEALFDVATDAARPFTIDAPPVRVTVLGTRFVLRAWPARERAEVVVTEGTVRVTSAAGDRDIAAGQALTFADDAISTASGIDFAAETAWLHGALAFTDAPLASILPRLERRFGVTFDSAAATVLDRRVSATFDAPDLDRALAAIGLALGITFERQGTVVRIR